MISEAQIERAMQQLQLPIMPTYCFTKKELREVVLTVVKVLSDPPPKSQQGWGN